MRKIDLILSAMLVPYAISQTAMAADNHDLILKASVPASNTWESSPSIENNSPSQRIRGYAQPSATPGESHTNKDPSTIVGQNDSLPSAPHQALSPSPPSAPQIAVATPANSQENLFKRLNGWSSVITAELVAPISTNTAKVGDFVEAKLAEAFCWGPQLIADKDSIVRGHVTEVESARTLTGSALSGERRLKTRGRLSVQFDEIVDQTGYRWPILATPSPRQKNLSKINGSSVRCVDVDADSRIVKAESDLAGGLKATSNAAKVASMVPLPGTMLFTALAPAVAMGAVGAASPSVAYDKPIDDSTEHRRTKGAAYGFFSNLPGAGLVKAVVEKGDQISLEPGDRLMLNVCIKDTGYKLPPGEQHTVNGKLMNVPAVHRLYPPSYGQQK
jgi:hypothetical protein